MKIKNTLLASLAMLVLLCGACGRNSIKTQLGIDSTKPKKYYSEADLSKLMAVGMTINEVTNTFGLPGSAVNEGDNKIHLRYMFRFDPSRTESGFGIDIKNGRVVRWDSIRQGVGYTLQGGGSQGSLGERKYEVFLATGDLTNVANIIDSQGKADVAYLKAAPDVVFNAKVFTGDSGGGHSGEQSVILVVGEQDSLKLRNLTENNLGKRLLIVCRNQAIAAPLISVPLASRQVEFTVKDANVLSVIHDR